MSFIFWIEVHTILRTPKDLDYPDRPHPLMPPVFLGKTTTKDKEVFYVDESKKIPEEQWKDGLRIQVSVGNLGMAFMRWYHPPSVRGKSKSKIRFATQKEIYKWWEAYEEGPTLEYELDDAYERTVAELEHPYWVLVLNTKKNKTFFYHDKHHAITIDPRPYKGWTVVLKGGVVAELRKGNEVVDPMMAEAG